MTKKKRDKRGRLRPAIIRHRPRAFFKGGSTIKPGYVLVLTGSFWRWLVLWPRMIRAGYRTHETMFEMWCFIRYYGGPTL